MATSKAASTPPRTAPAIAPALFFLLFGSSKVCPGSGIAPEDAEGPLLDEEEDEGVELPGVESGVVELAGGGVVVLSGLLGMLSAGEILRLVKSEAG